MVRRWRPLRLARHPSLIGVDVETCSSPRNERGPKLDAFRTSITGSGGKLSSPGREEVEHLISPTLVVARPQIEQTAGQGSGSSDAASQATVPSHGRRGTGVPSTPAPAAPRLAVLIPGAHPRTTVRAAASVAFPFVTPSHVTRSRAQARKVRSGAGSRWAATPFTRRPARSAEERGACARLVRHPGCGPGTGRR